MASLIAGKFIKKKPQPAADDSEEVAEARRLERAASVRRRGRVSTVAGSAEGTAQLGQATLLGR